MALFYILLIFFGVSFIINMIHIYGVCKEDRKKLLNDNNEIWMLLGAIASFILMCIFIYRIIFW